MGQTSCILLGFDIQILTVLGFDIQILAVCRMFVP